MNLHKATHVTIIMTMTNTNKNNPLWAGRQAIAEEIRAAMARTRTTREKISAETGIDPRVCSRKTNGSAPVGIEELIAIADIIGIPPMEFVETVTQAAMDAEDEAGDEA